MDRQGPLRARRKAADRASQDRQCRPDLYFRRQSAADPGRARSGKACALRRDAAAARRQGARRQPLLPVRQRARQRHHAQRGRRPNADRHSRYRAPSRHHARQPSGLCARRRLRRHWSESAGTSGVDGDAGARRPLGPRAGGQRRLCQARRRQCRRGGAGFADAIDKRRGPAGAGRCQRHCDPRLRRDRQRQGERASVPSRAGDGLDRGAHCLRHRLARGAGHARRHPDHHPAYACSPPR